MYADSFFRPLSISGISRPGGREAGGRQGRSRRSRVARRQAAAPCGPPGASGTRSRIPVVIPHDRMLARPDANGPREKSGQSLPL